MSFNEVHKMYDLKAHMERERYGNFLMPYAVRPAFPPELIPVNGYKKGEPGEPAFSVSVSREKVIQVLSDLLALTGARPMVFFGVETHIGQFVREKVFLKRKIDRPVLRSYLCRIEDILLGNGFVFVQVVDREVRNEIYFDADKLIHVLFTDRTEKTRKILIKNGIPYIPNLRFFCDQEGHFHQETEGSMDGFFAFLDEIGVEKA